MFCERCGANLSAGAKFCGACGTKTDAAASEHVGNAMPAAPVYTDESPRPEESGPRQAGTYDQQPSTEGNPYTGYSGAVNHGINDQKKNNKGLLIGGIIGLVALAGIIAAVILIFGKPPADNPQNNNAGVAHLPADSGAQEEQRLPVADNVKKDAVLSDIAGMWEGEFRFTRMEGFDQVPAEERSRDMDALIKEILAHPAPLEFEIEEDGHWDFHSGGELDMWFSSSDFEGDGYNPLQITGLSNGAFELIYSEEIDEGGFMGQATFMLSGTVYESGDGLYMEGTISISMPTGGKAIIQEGVYSVILTEPADTDAANGREPDYENQDRDDGAADNGLITAGPSLSTAERPDWSDFLWYVDGVYAGGLPGNGSPITEFSALTGGWKAFFYYDPENTIDAYGFELLNAEISGSSASAEITLDFYKVYPDGYEEYDTSDTEDAILYGMYDNNGITASGDGYMIYMTDFYDLNGRQYGVGYMEPQSGEPTFVALIRP